MTAQAGDLIYIRGKAHPMANDMEVKAPAMDWFDMQFIPSSTACWRGYEATWRLKRNKLFLQDFSGLAEVRDKERFREEKGLLRQRMKRAEITPVQYSRLLKQLQADLLQEVSVDMQFLFGSDQPVWAQWFNGFIRIPQGEMLMYRHAGYMSVFEAMQILQFQDGVLIKSKVVDTGKYWR